MSSQIHSKHALKKLVVIGASAGGVESLIALVKDIPGTMDCPICITIHTSPVGGGRLPEILNRRGHLLAKLGTDGEVLVGGQIYIAPADLHMRIEDGRIRLDRGPKENRNRPSINSLFRSAARNFDGLVIGIILSGLLDDGTAGMKEIKARGGITIVQDPLEAIFSGMPESVIQNVSVDHILKLADIAPYLVRLCEMELDELKSDEQVEPSAELETPMPPSFICPDCGGALQEKLDKNRNEFFECIVGHRLTAQSFWAGQHENIERILWSASRALKERADFSKLMAKRCEDQLNDSSTARKFNKEAEAAQRDAESIESMINAKKSFFN